MKKSVSTQRKYSSAVVPNLKKKIRIACEIYYPFLLRKGKIHLKVLLCVLERNLKVYIRNLKQRLFN